MKQFTNLYPVTKTLRFELIPDSRTKKYLENSDFINCDEHRAEYYKIVKKIIDRYHKVFIEEVLSSTKLQYVKTGRLDSLEELYSLLVKSQKTESDKKSIAKVQDKLRKQIVDAFKNDSRFKRIDKKELIREDIFKLVELTPEERALVEEFRDFTTYFNGFHENRKNMYSSEAQSTAIAFRLIHENLPKFIDNIAIFHRILRSPVAENFQQLYKDMEEYLNVNSLEEMFMLDYYNDVLTQTQIDVYNAIIGGRTLEDGKKIQGINEYVNLFNQQQSSRETCLPKLKPLYKQILSDKVAVSWLPEEFATDNELLEAVRDCYTSLSNNVFVKLEEMLTNLSEYNLNGVFIPNDLSLTNISQWLYGDWSFIKKAITKDLMENCPSKKNEKPEKYEERLEKHVKSEGYFSIAYLNSCLNNVQKNVCSYFNELGAVNTESKQIENLFSKIQNAYTDAKDLLESDYPKNKNLAQEKSEVAKIKLLLDALKELQHFVKPLTDAGDKAEKDEQFYSEMTIIWDDLSRVTPLYNKVRNRMTRKPYSLEKFKLTFNIKGNFLGGWVDSKTEKSDNGTQYGGYLFRRKNAINEYDYYLGVSANTKLFRRQSGVVGEYERLDYYQPKSQTIYGNSYVGNNSYETDKEELKIAILEFVSKLGNDELLQQVGAKDTPSAMLTVIKESSNVIFNQLLIDEEFAKKNREVTDNLHQTILGMSRIPRAKEYRDASFTIFTEPQQVIDDICKDKVFSYFPVSDVEMNNAISDINKPFLLFKISNKDLSFAEMYSKGLRKSRGIENLHTMYFKALMEGNQSVLDIGTGEMFYRRASIKVAKPTHPSNQPIQKKSQSGESMFAYDLIKDRRFTVDKFGFHLSIIQNYQAAGKVDVNSMVRSYIHDNPDMHFIGIDRGERHLLYVSVIDSKGNIKEQFSMNQITKDYNGVEYKTNYRNLLDIRDDVRKQERQSWRTIEGIKELKQGYLSQVIHKIVTLMVKYRAIVVLEDLNMGFKRGRQKVESSVYQQFEKALIDKLSYLVDKQQDANKCGGLLKGFQLTNKFTSFRDMKKQNGFLFYIPAWNTSKIDPVTGFVDLLHPKYENVDKARSFFCKFKSIRYNKQKGWYEFTFDYNDFTTQAEGTRTLWTICTRGSRIETFRNKDKNSEWDSHEINLTDEFNSLFCQYNISSNDNLKEVIASQTDKKFFESLIHLLCLTLQMRNSKTGTDIDYLISPVANEHGLFYDSRNCDSSLPENADANGAYNIARKGLWMARQIQGAERNEKIDFVITNKEWLNFAQTKPYLTD